MTAPADGRSPIEVLRDPDLPRRDGRGVRVKLSRRG
jgi:hypothetical protein